MMSERMVEHVAKKKLLILDTKTSVKCFLSHLFR